MKYLLSLPLFLLFSCRSDAVPPIEKPDDFMSQVTLKSYTVPPGMQEPLKEILNRNFRSLSNDSSTVARIEVLPNGQVALLAPYHIHQGMEELIKGLENAKLPPAENTVLDFWIVLGKTPEKSSFDSRLGEVKHVLEGADKAQQNFILLEKLRVNTALGTNSSATGTFFQIEYGLYKSIGNNLAELQISSEQGSHTRLRTQIYLKPGQYTVLGESAYQLDAGLAKRMNQEPGYYNLYYILKSGAVGE